MKIREKMDEKYAMFTARIISAVDFLENLTIYDSIISYTKVY